MRLEVPPSESADPVPPAKALSNYNSYEKLSIMNVVGCALPRNAAFFLCIVRE